MRTQYLLVAAVAALAVLNISLAWQFGWTTSRFVMAAVHVGVLCVNFATIRMIRRNG